MDTKLFTIAKISRNKSYKNLEKIDMIWSLDLK